MTTHESSGARGRTAGYQAPVQNAALGVGGIFLIVGVLGFIPGVTTQYEQLTWAGHHSGALLLGLFAVSVLHNIVHLAFGVAGVVLARWFDGARRYLIGGGVIYLALWLYGLTIDHGSAANFVPVNNAVNWLHLGLGVGMVVIGALLGRYAIHAGTGAMGTPESSRGAFPPGRSPGRSPGLS